MRAIPIDDYLEGLDGRPAPRSVDWARLVAEGRAARAAADGGAWRIGRLALLVERRYASGALLRFAQEIGESHATVRRFRWVAATFGEAERARFPELSFSHFQAVAAVPDGLAWLERARHGAWSVDRLVTESRLAAAAPASRTARLRRPVEAATRSLGRLTERLGTQPLRKAERAELAQAVDQLAEQVEALRARLRVASYRAARERRLRAR